MCGTITENTLKSNFSFCGVAETQAHKQLNVETSGKIIKLKLFFKTTDLRSCGLQYKSVGRS